jgi:subtilase family serine protease
VNLPASVPEVTGVGGSEFVEGSGNYWSSTNDGTSARSYIPERAWNASAPGKFLAASGGGASAAYPRPTWQTGPGVPNDNARHVPDITFSASLDHDPYLIVMNGEWATVGGTSASTEFFAGVLALLNEYVVKNGLQTKSGLGNINPRLYQFAQNKPGVFHDITTGNNTIPCKDGTPDCTAGQYGYNTGPGYDQVTGLGSIDLASMFEAWSVATPIPHPTTNVVISVEPSPVYKQAPDKDGYAWFYRVYVSETGGAPARITAFFVDDSDLSDNIAAWFGTVNLPAKGVLSADLKRAIWTFPRIMSSPSAASRAPESLGHNRSRLVFSARSPTRRCR